MENLTIVILIAAALSIAAIIYWIKTPNGPLSDPSRCPECGHRGRSMEIFSAPKGNYTETILWQCNHCEGIWTTEHTDKP